MGRLAFTTENMIKGRRVSPDTGVGSVGGGDIVSSGDFRCISEARGVANLTGGTQIVGGRQDQYAGSDMYRGASRLQWRTVNLNAPYSRMILISRVRCSPNLSTSMGVPRCLSDIVIVLWSSSDLKRMGGSFDRPSASTTTS